MTNIVEIASLKDLLADKAARLSLLSSMAAGDAIIIRDVIPNLKIQQIKNYLRGIGRSSLPNWQPLVPNCPNFHRVNNWDQRSFVKACFHQFSFFPWNDDVLNLYATFKDIFTLRNLLSGADASAYLGPEPFDHCIARISFQFYPRGGGAMNKHKDPQGPHQAVVPILIMSKLGEDFTEGGAFLESTSGETIFLERFAGPGDLVFFDPQMPHGVAPIDPESEMDWPLFEGRWMSIFAVNKLTTNTQIANATDIGEATRATAR
jgi:hypothetical protein